MVDLPVMNLNVQSQYSAVQKSHQTRPTIFYSVLQPHHQPFAAPHSYASQPPTKFLSVSLVNHMVHSPYASHIIFFLLGKPYFFLPSSPGHVLSDCPDTIFLCAFPRACSQSKSPLLYPACCPYLLVFMPS